MADVRVELPSLEEQRRISSYLDANSTKVASVRQLIERQTSLLIERRQAVIDQELGFLTSSVPMKRVVSVVDTEHKTAPGVVGGEYWVAGTSAVRQGRVVLENLYETDRTTYEEWTRRRRPTPGDIFMSREAPVGEIGLYQTNDPRIAIGQRMVVLSLRNEENSSEFLMWNLLSTRTIEHVRNLTQGSLHPHLNVSDIGSIPIAQAESDTQFVCAERIAESVNRVNDLMTLRLNQMTLLGQRNRSLISVATRGKIDVSTVRGNHA